MSRDYLYSQEITDSARQREWERMFQREDDEKAELILARLAGCESVVDVGCGWGQLLGRIAEVVPRAIGVDESPHRIADAARTVPGAELLSCRASAIDLPDGGVDAAVCSQMLHEVKLFGDPGEVRATLQELRRIVKSGGRLLLLDHLDPGEGIVHVELAPEAYHVFETFCAKFLYRRVRHGPAEPIGGGFQLDLDRRDLQEFVTKTWALGSALEEIEMSETHCAFTHEELAAELTETGFAIGEWLPFCDIGGDLERNGVRLLDADPWLRKFLLTAHAR
jgi:ubiquinone/menaquinone biosynthesis C-methylase UbiE